MLLIGYGRNDDSVICMALIQQEKQNIFLIFQKVEWYSFWFLTSLHKLSRTPPGFKAGQYCDTYKKALSFQRLSSCKSIMLGKRI